MLNNEFCLTDPWNDCEGQIVCSSFSFSENNQLITNSIEHSSCKDSAGCHSGILTESACNEIAGLHWDDEEYCNYMTWDRVP